MAYMERVIGLVAIVFIFEISIVALAQTYSSTTSSLVYLHMIHPHEQATFPRVRVTRIPAVRRSKRRTGVIDALRDAIAVATISG